MEVRLQTIRPILGGSEDGAWDALNELSDRSETCYLVIRSSSNKYINIDVGLVGLSQQYKMKCDHELSLNSQWWKPSVRLSNETNLLYFTSQRPMCVLSLDDPTNYSINYKSINYKFINSC